MSETVEEAKIFSFFFQKSHWIYFLSRHISKTVLSFKCLASPYSKSWKVVSEASVRG